MIFGPAAARLLVGVVGTDQGVNLIGTNTTDELSVPVEDVMFAFV